MANIGAPTGTPIRVSVPPEVLTDLDAFQRAQSAILGKLGCRGCTSGFHFLWQSYSDYMVDTRGEVRAVLPAAAAEEPSLDAG